VRRRGLGRVLKLQAKIGGVLFECDDAVDELAGVVGYA
jgi:hypothetical protein